MLRHLHLVGVWGGGGEGERKTLTDKENKIYTQIYSGCGVSAFGCDFFSNFEFHAKTLNRAFFFFFFFFNIYFISLFPLFFLLVFK